MIKTTLDILQECSELDLSKNTMNENYEVEKEINDFIGSLQEMSIEFTYDASAVPVLENETFTGKEYYMELDNIVKLSESADVDIKKAMEMVAEFNSISFENCYLVLDEKCGMQEALKCKDKEEKCKVKKAITDIKEKCIKTVCKKK